MLMCLLCACVCLCVLVGDCHEWEGVFMFYVCGVCISVNVFVCVLFVCICGVCIYVVYVCVSM